MGIVIVWLLLSVAVGLLADSRGRSGFGFFLLSAVFSPLLGLIVVLVMSDLNAEKAKEQRRREEHEKQIESIRAIASSGSRSAEGDSSAQFARPVADEIAKLGDLKAKGLLTDDEFRAQKAILLNQTHGKHDMDAVNHGLGRRPETQPEAINRAALREAVLARNFFEVKRLLDAGADPNCADLSGKQPLDLACELGDQQIAALLRSAGAQ